MKLKFENASFFDRPGRALLIFSAVSAILFTLQCTIFQNVLPLDVIETIVWGAQGQLGHMKHPPLSGWIGYAFSWISGYHDWSMYLAAQLCLICGVFYTYRLAREFLSEYAAAAAALLLYILPYYTPSSMKFCSHFLETAFLPAMAFYFYRGMKENKIASWLLLGFFTALATLAKYSAAQILPAFLLWMLWTPENRKRFRSFGPYLSGIFCLILLAPHIWWLVENDFMPVRHLSDRMNQEIPPWYMPFAVFGTMIYPLFLEAAALLLCFFPWKRGELVREPFRKNAFVYAMLLTLVPGGFYVGISLFRHHVILMWFSYLASFTGMAVAAAVPWKITKAVFSRLYVLIALVALFIFIGTTIDIAVKARPKLHMDPHELVGIAEDFYAKHASGPIPVVVGQRWVAGCVENYSATRPPTCIDSDLYDFKLYEKKIREQGALLISFSDDDFAPFFKQLNRPANSVRFEYFTLKCRPMFGKPREEDFKIGYFPPDPRP